MWIDRQEYLIAICNGTKARESCDWQNNFVHRTSFQQFFHQSFSSGMSPSKELARVAFHTKVLFMLFSSGYKLSAITFLLKCWLRLKTECAIYFLRLKNLLDFQFYFRYVYLETWGTEQNNVGDHMLFLHLIKFKEENCLHFFAVLIQWPWRSLRKGFISDMTISLLSPQDTKRNYVIWLQQPFGSRCTVRHLSINSSNKLSIN